MHKGVEAIGGGEVVTWGMGGGDFDSGGGGDAGLRSTTPTLQQVTSDPCIVTNRGYTED